MKKGLRSIKRAIALVLVLLLSIESFAAVVSDNDGSAFITKGEFDSLKNSFQSQIDQYNTSIDSKIDGAIAAYLAGIKTKHSEEIAPLISNYDEIRWQNGYKFYGRQRNWTSRTTYTGGSNLEWIKPVADSRWNLRTDNIDIFDYAFQAYSAGSMWFNFAIDEVSGGLSFGENGSANGQPVNTLCFREMYDAVNQEWIPDAEPWWLVGCAARQIYPYIHRSSSTGTDQQWWNIENQAFEIDSFVINPLVDDDLMNYTIHFHRQGRTEDLYHQERIKTSNSNFPNPYDHRSLFRSDSEFNNWNARTSIIADWAAAKMTDNSYFANGCHDYIGKEDYHYRQCENVRRYMSGADDNTEVNIFRWSQGKQSGDPALDFDNPPSYGKIKGRITYGIIQNPKFYNTAITTQRPTFDVPFEIAIPHFTKAKLSNENSKILRYNGKYLKMGQGIPLLVGAQNKGDLQISFDYKVFKLLDLSNLNKKIYIDVKKDDFISSGTNYHIGYDGLIDTENATTPSYELRRHAMNESSGKVNMTIPVGQDEDVWFRICPQEAEGAFVQMANLKMYFVTN